jgi:thymidylate synthase (FAD)
MFKTIAKCRLDLVAYSVKDVSDNGNIDDLTEPYEVYRYQSLDFMPCSAARVSFGNEDKTGKNVEADKKLMKYLADEQHLSPFEHQSATFLIECPLFIRSQIMRHRTFAFNEISRRYTDENLEFWKPDVFRKQSESNRQSSTDEVIHYLEDGSDALELHQDTATMMLQIYNAMVSRGICKEQARSILPQSLLTKFYMSGNLRAWVHFIKLRRDAHAQKEVQVIAERIETKLRDLWPNSMEALMGSPSE